MNKTPFIILFLLFTLIPDSLYSQKKKLTENNKQMHDDAVYCIEKENYDCALFIYNQLIELEPENVNFIFERAKTYILLGDYAKAMEDLETAQTIDSKIKDQIYDAKGRIYILHNDYRSAITEYNNAILFNDTCISCYGNRGYAYSLVYESEKAIQDYQKVLSMDKTNRGAIRNLGIEYINSNRYDSALTVYNQAVMNDSTFATIYLYRGLVYFEIGDFERGEEDILKALNIDSQIANILLQQVKRYTLGNNLSIADRLLELMIIVFPNEKTFYVERAELKSFQRDIPKAIENYSQAIIIDSNDIELYFKRGKLYFNEHLYNEAVKDFTFLLKQDPRNTDCLLKRGYAYYRLNNKERAKTDWEEALALGEKKAQNYLDTYFSSY